jgi:hypothetical protein
MILKANLFNNIWDNDENIGAVSAKTSSRCRSFTRSGYNQE